MIEEVNIQLKNHKLQGQIYVTTKPKSWAILSLENNLVNTNLAQKMALSGHATLLGQLQTAEEFLVTTEWLIHSKHYHKRTPLGFLSADEAAAAAFSATAHAPEDTLISTVISINGQLDKVDENVLTAVNVPSLLIVDDNVKLIKVNEYAAQFIPYCEITLNATHDYAKTEKLIIKWLDHYAINRKRKITNILQQQL